jgi:hypothetical protein
MAVYDDDGMHRVEMLLVEVMEPVKPPTGQGTQGDGA